MNDADQTALLSVVKTQNARIEQLEKALMPFAVFGAMLENVRFDLIAAGDDPAKVEPGGTWYATKTQMLLQPAHGLFKQARLSLGIEKTNQNIIDASNQALAEAVAQEEKSERDEYGKKGN